MKILGIVQVTVLFLSGIACATRDAAVQPAEADVNRHFFRKRPPGLSFHEVGAEVMVTQLSPASARVGIVVKRRITNESPANTRWDDVFLPFPEIECRSGESAEYRWEIDPAQGPRFVLGTIDPNQDGIWLKISCSSVEGGLVVDYRLDVRDGDLSLLHVAGRQRVEDRKK